MRATSAEVSHGADTVQALTLETAVALRMSGVSWVARYIARDGRQLTEPDRHGGDFRGCWSLSRQELAAILSAGLAVVPIQWGPWGGSTLSGPNGRRLGEAAVEQATWLGLPTGVHLWCDLEGGAAGRSGTDGCKAFVEGFAAPCLAAGWRAGLYIGDPGVPLDAEELHRLAGVTAYWRSCTHVQALTRRWYPRFRGWSILQTSLPTELAGVQVDLDVMRADDRGDLPTWVAL